MKIPNLKLSNYGNDTLDYPPGFQISQVGLQRCTRACLAVPVRSPSNKTPHSSQCLQDLAAIYIPHIEAWPDFDNLPGYPNNPHHNSCHHRQELRDSDPLVMRMVKGH